MWIPLCYLKIILLIISIIIPSILANFTLSYEFLRDDCFKGAIPPATYPDPVGDLTLDLDTRSNTSVCLLGNGVTSSAGIPISTSKYLSLFVADLSSKSTFTLEFWVRLLPNTTTSSGATLTAELPVISLIYSASAQSTTGCTYPFQVAVKAEKQLGSSTASSVGINVKTCSKQGGSALFSSNIMPASDSMIEHIHHVAVIMSFSNYTVTVGSYKINLYTTIANFTIDGVPAGHSMDMGISANYAPSYWNKNCYLNVFPDGAVSDLDVEMYMLSFYDRALVHSEILTSYKAGLSNSPPIIVSQSVSVQEDGEVGNHFDDPAFYESEIPVLQLATIQLSIFDTDDQPYSPNYRANKSHAVALIDLSSLPSPSVGVFYFLNGTQILPSKSNTSEVTIPRDATTGDYLVRFRPAANTYSSKGHAYCSFTFTAIDSVTGTKATLPSTATVSVYVTHVDKPPQPLTDLSATVLEGKTTVLAMNGTDSDSRIVSSWITALPSYGSLHHIFKNGSVSAQAIALTEGGFKLNSTMKVAYRTSWSPPTSSTPYNSTSGYLFSDNFTFALQDVEGRKSIGASYGIDVYTSLTATAAVSSSSVTMSKTSSCITSSKSLATEGVKSAITVYASDLSDSPRVLHVTVTSLPEHGTLYRTNTSSATSSLRIGDTVTVPSSGKKKGKATLYYLGNGTYFTSPSCNASGGAVLPTSIVTPDSFQFMTVASDGLQSEIMTQTVTIKNVNDPSTLSYTYAGGSLSVNAISGTKASADQSSTLTLTGFTIIDPDLGVDYVVAHVHTTNGGRISLNPNYVGLLDFTSIKYCFSTLRWWCTGSGTSDTKEIFVGTPLEIMYALNGMTYRSSKAGVTDTVNITIYDGVGGACLENSALGSGSVRVGCFESSIDFQVNVLTGSTSSSAYSTSIMSSIQLEYRIIAIAAIGFCVFCCCGYCYVRRRRRRRERQRKDNGASYAVNGAAIDEEEEDDEDDDDDPHGEEGCEREKKESTVKKNRFGFTWCRLLSLCCCLSSPCCFLSSLCCYYCCCRKKPNKGKEEKATATTPGRRSLRGASNSLRAKKNKGLKAAAATSTSYSTNMIKRSDKLDGSDAVSGDEGRDRRLWWVVDDEESQSQHQQKHSRPPTARVVEGDESKVGEDDRDNNDGLHDDKQGRNKTSSFSRFWTIRQSLRKSPALAGGQHPCQPATASAAHTDSVNRVAGKEEKSSVTEKGSDRGHTKASLFNIWGWATAGTKETAHQQQQQQLQQQEELPPSRLGGFPQYFGGIQGIPGPEASYAYQTDANHSTGHSFPVRSTRAAAAPFYSGDCALPEHTQGRSSMQGDGAKAPKQSLRKFGSSNIISGSQAVTRRAPQHLKVHRHDYRFYNRDREGEEVEEEEDFGVTCSDIDEDELAPPQKNSSYSSYHHHPVDDFYRSPVRGGGGGGDGRKSNTSTLSWTHAGFAEEQVGRTNPWSEEFATDAHAQQLQQQLSTAVSSQQMMSLAATRQPQLPLPLPPQLAVAPPRSLPVSSKSVGSNGNPFDFIAEDSNNPRRSIGHQKQPMRQNATAMVSDTSSRHHTPMNHHQKNLSSDSPSTPQRTIVPQSPPPPPHSSHDSSAAEHITNRIMQKVAARRLHRSAPNGGSNTDRGNVESAIYAPPNTSGGGVGAVQATQIHRQHDQDGSRRKHNQDLDRLSHIAPLGDLQHAHRYDDMPMQAPSPLMLTRTRTSAAPSSPLFRGGSTGGGTSSANTAKTVFAEGAVPVVLRSPQPATGTTPSTMVSAKSARRLISGSGDDGGRSQESSRSPHLPAAVSQVSVHDFPLPSVPQATLAAASTSSSVTMHVTHARLSHSTEKRSVSRGHTAFFAGQQQLSPGEKHT